MELVKIGNGRLPVPLAIGFSFARGSFAKSYPCDVLPEMLRCRPGLRGVEQVHGHMAVSVPHCQNMTASSGCENQYRLRPCQEKKLISLKSAQRKTKPRPT